MARLSAKYNFKKPNDRRALDLMNAAATAVLHDMPDITMAYGVSDEFRWVAAAYSIGNANIVLALFSINIVISSNAEKGKSWFRFLGEGCSNSSSKITSTVVSTFTAYYVYLWAHYFPDTPLSAPLPSFDGRAVLYPDTQILRDYMSWRQADCKQLKRNPWLHTDATPRPHQQSIQHCLLGNGSDWRVHPDTGWGNFTGTRIQAFLW